MAAIVRGRSIGIAAILFAVATVAEAADAGETQHPSGLVQSTAVERGDGLVEVYQSVRHADGTVTPVQNRM